MSDNDKEEPMDVDSSNDDTQPPSSSHDNSAEARMPSSKSEDEVLLTLSYKWLGPDRPQKLEMTLEKLLQSWVNKLKIGADCSVIEASGDDSALIKIKPVPALSDLKTLIGETLSNRERKVTIMSVSLTPQNLKTEMPEDASLDRPPSFVSEPPQNVQMPSSKNEDEVLLTLSCKWLGPDHPQKPKKTLEKLLQSWFNKRKIVADCSVIEASGDGRVSIKIKPVPALHELGALIGETLSNKEGRVTIMSVSLTP